MIVPVRVPSTILGLSRILLYLFTDVFSLVLLCMYIYSYIYIYIYICVCVCVCVCLSVCGHPQTDCFVESQIFSVARHVGRLKLGSKPAKLYVRLCIIALRQQANHISSRIIKNYVVTSVCLYFCLTGVLNSFEELCIMRVAAIYSYSRVLNHSGGAYTHIHIYIYIFFFFFQYDFIYIYI